MEALTLQSRASRPTSPQPMDRDDWDDVEGNRFRIKYAHRYADYVDGGRDFFVKDIYGKDEADDLTLAERRALRRLLKAELMARRKSDGRIMT